MTLMPSSKVRGFFGHHKCGSTWVYHILTGLAKAAGVPAFYSNGPHDFGDKLAPAVLLEHGAELLLHVNADYEFLTRGGVELEGVHVVRDPRDLLVSAYYSHRSSHPAGDWPDLQEFRRILQTIPVSEGLLLELEFSADVFQALASWPHESATPGILLVRFEEIVADPLGCFTRLADHLDLLRGVQPGTLETLVETYSFERLSGGRQVGEEDAEHHYRKGIAGDWKRHFGPQHNWLFMRRHGQLLEHYGYDRESK